MSDNKEESVETGDNKSYPVQFRISGEQARAAQRLADMLYKNGAIKTNSINALMRACAFTQINLYLQFEAKENAFQQRQMELEQDKERLARQGVLKYGTIPSLGV